MKNQRGLLFFYSKISMIFITCYSEGITAGKKFQFLQCLNTEEILISLHAACTCLGSKTW